LLFALSVAALPGILAGAPPLSVQSIARSGAKVIVSFNGGTLQSGTAITGPWADVPGSASPYSTYTLGTMRFFRTRDNLGNYSVNAVGYVNINLGAGWNLIQNPLNSGNNTVAEVLPTVPEHTRIMKQMISGVILFEISNDYDQGSWRDPSMVFKPGEGVALYLPSPGNTTVTFVGEVGQGDRSINFSAGFNLIGSIVPQAGRLVSDLGYPVVHGTTIYTYSPGVGYTVYDYTSLFGWIPHEPVLTVGQAFWSHQPSAGAWTRQFIIK